MIKFISTKGEGFGSFIKPTKFKLDRPGLNIIIAKNGSGKSTVFNLLNWTLYGTSLKEGQTIPTWHHFRNSDWKGTIGHTTFEKDGNVYEVIRCKKYKGKVWGGSGKDRLIFICNNLDKSLGTKRETQTLINSTLGYTAELFKNSILFGQKLKRLSQESGPEKKKVFDEAFESKFIAEARNRGALKLELLNQEFKELDIKLDKLRNEKTNTKNAYLELKKSKEKQEQINQRDLKELKGRVKNLKKFINEYSAVELKITQKKLGKAEWGLKSLSNITQEIDDLESREFRETNLADDLEHQIGVQENTIKWGNEAYRSVITKCPRCGQKLSADKIQAEKKLIKDKVKEAKNQIEILRTKLESQKVVINDLLGKISSKNKDKNNINALNQSIKRLRIQIRPLEAKDNEYKSSKKYLNNLKENLTYQKNKKININLKPFKKSLKRVKKDILKVKPQWKDIKLQIKHLNWALNDVLGNKGLKSYIFDTMLKELNEILKYYEQFIGYRIEFNVDLDSANKDIYTLCYIGKNSCLYEDLSGAQSQLVDIATAFALNDLVTQGRPMNIMIFDEVMDNLDEENQDIVYDLIINKATTSSIFLITHDINLQSASSTVIRMSYDKKSGQSIMKII